MNGQPAPLYGKRLGGDENGLGVNGEWDSEIQPGEFLQLDLTQLIASGATNAMISIGSVQPGEKYNIYDLRPWDRKAIC